MRRQLHHAIFSVSLVILVMDLFLAAVMVGYALDFNRSADRLTLDGHAASVFQVAMGSTLRPGMVSAAGLLALLIVLGASLVRHGGIFPIGRKLAATERGQADQREGAARQPGDGERDDLRQPFSQTAAQLHASLAERDSAPSQHFAVKHTPESARSAKRTFLANMSHELRTPLTSILGYADLLRLQVEERGMLDLVPDIAIIEEAGNHLLAVIGNILDLSRLEAGRLELTSEIFALPAVATEVLVALRPLIECNANSCHVTFSDDLEMMHSDRSKVKQILFHLLSNAAKFTIGGEITLTIRRDAAHGNRIAFQVADTGRGMPPDQIEQLFQAFATSDYVLTSRYEGDGHGLALCYRLCQMLGGEMSVASEVGHGTSFTVYLPASLTHHEIEQEQPAEQPSPRLMAIQRGIGDLIEMID